MYDDELLNEYLGGLPISSNEFNSLVNRVNTSSDQYSAFSRVTARLVNQLSDMDISTIYSTIGLGGESSIIVELISLVTIAGPGFIEKSFIYFFERVL